MTGKEVADILNRYPDYEVEIMMPPPQNKITVYAIAPNASRKIISIMPIIQADRRAESGSPKS